MNCPKRAFTMVQQAPGLSTPSGVLHGARVTPCQVASKIAQFKKLGKMYTNTAIESRVSSTFEGLDKRFCRTQPIGPVVRIGGGNEGYVPGA
jgi:hypothetical protein